MKLHKPQSKIPKNFITTFLIIESLSYITENCTIDQCKANEILADLKNRKDMVQMTFENNTIIDSSGICNVFE